VTDVAAAVAGMSLARRRKCSREGASEPSTSESSAPSIRRSRASALASTPASPGTETGGGSRPEGNGFSTCENAPAGSACSARVYAASCGSTSTSSGLTRSGAAAISSRITAYPLVVLLLPGATDANDEAAGASLTLDRVFFCTPRFTLATGQREDWISHDGA
jgi:hypothetical protein